MEPRILTHVDSISSSLVDSLALSKNRFFEGMRREITSKWLSTIMGTLQRYKTPPAQTNHFQVQVIQRTGLPTISNTTRSFCPELVIRVPRSKPTSSSCPMPAVCVETLAPLGRRWPVERQETVSNVYVEVFDWYRSDTGVPPTTLAPDRGSCSAPLRPFVAASRLRFAKKMAFAERLLPLPTRIRSFCGAGRSQRISRPAWI